MDTTLILEMLGIFIAFLSFIYAFVRNARKDICERMDKNFDRLDAKLTRMDNDIYQLSQRVARIEGAILGIESRKTGS